MHIDLGIVVRDIDACLPFYRDVLGLPESEYSAGEVETPNVTLGFWDPEADGERFVANESGIASLRKEVMDTVDRELGAIGRPGAVHFVSVLPKTRSGKLLRRSIQALAEGRDPGDLTTIEDPAALEAIRAALATR